MAKLTALGMKRLTKPGRYGDGGGLWLQVRDAEHRSWLFRYKLHGKARQMGLGAFADVPLGEARDAATGCRRLVRDGIDPIEHRAVQRAERAAKANALTFKQVAERYITSHKAGWKNEKHEKIWENSLETYAAPVFGDHSVNTVTTADIVKVLEPIWRSKTETATRVRMRIQAVLDYATAQGWRSGDNPARWRGHLDKLLPAPRKVTKVEHHPSLPYSEVPAFLVDVKAQGGTAPLALRFAILTACRTGEAIGARWTEIDLDKALWTVPTERMKSDREHRVPLSAPALAILQELLPLMTKPSDFVFPGQGKAGHLSNMALGAVLKRMDKADITTHGFRSSFRNWAAEKNPAPREVAEMALAHTLGSKTEAAYMRSDLFDLRAKLMNDWAAFCCPPKP